MNILETIEAIQNGKCIRYIDEDGDFVFIFQTTLLPLGKKSFVTVEEADLGDEPPYSLETLEYNELREVCLNAILACNFTEVTFEEMLSQLREIWRVNREEEKEEDEEDG